MRKRVIMLFTGRKGSSSSVLLVLTIFASRLSMDSASASPASCSFGLCANGPAAALAAACDAGGEASSAILSSFSQPESQMAGAPEERRAEQVLPAATKAFACHEKHRLPRKASFAR